MDLDYEYVSIGKNTTTGYIVNFHEMLYWIKDVTKTDNGMLVDKVQKEGRDGFFISHNAHYVK